MTNNNQSVVVLAKDQQEFILINQFRNPINDYTIQLPGGGVNHEEELEEAAKREFLEETGFRCGKLTYLGKIRPASWISNEVTFVYYTEDVIEYIGQSLESHENIEVVKMPIEEIFSNINNGMIDDSELCFALLQGMLKGLIKDTKGLKM